MIEVRGMLILNYQLLIVSLDYYVNILCMSHINSNLIVYSGFN